MVSDGSEPTANVAEQMATRIVQLNSVAQGGPTLGVVFKLPQYMWTRVAIVCIFALGAFGDMRNA